MLQNCFVWGKCPLKGHSERFSELPKQNKMVIFVTKGAFPEVQLDKSYILTIFDPLVT
jgi:hypothetical protein